MQQLVKVRLQKSPLSLFYTFLLALSWTGVNACLQPQPSIHTFFSSSLFAPFIL